MRPSQKQCWRSLALCLAALFGFVCALAAKPDPVVYLPRNVSGSLPVAVWLHGYRSFPGALGDAEFFQGVADTLSIAIIGIPGTTTLDDETLQWSEEPVADHAYIQSALGVLKAKHDLDLGRVALFGFSQGAMVAGDLALAYPTVYRGALLMSPGGMTAPHLSMRGTPSHGEQTYIVVCGAEEHPGNVQWTMAYGERAKAVSAHTLVKQYEGMKEHTRPPDFKVKFPIWIGAILGLRKADQH